MSYREALKLGFIAMAVAILTALVVAGFVLVGNLLLGWPGMLLGGLLFTALMPFVFAFMETR